MPPIWLRLTVAIVFLFAWCALFYLEAASVGSSQGIDSSGDPWGWVFLVLYVALALSTGFVVGWPALALPGIVYLALLPLGENPADSDLHTYAFDYLFVGFWVFIVILIGWLLGVGTRLARRRRDPTPNGAGDVRIGSRDRRLLLVPVVLLAAISALLIALVVQANGTQVETPKLSIEGVTRTPPKPTDNQLRLLATDVDSCGSGSDKVIDLATDEAAAEIVIAASLEVDRQFPCGFSNGARVPVVVALEEPLGQRAVIDDSRGARSLIWTAAAGERLASLTTEDAEAFLLSKRPGSDARCKRVRSDFFSCDFIRAASGRRRLRGVTVLATGELALG